MLKKSKRGEGKSFINATISIILAAVAVAVMLALLGRLIFSDFNEEEETEKSYLSNFNKQLQIADKGETGEFKMLSLGEGRKEYYFVYFGDKSVRRINIGGVKEFVLKKNLENPFCICFIKENYGICNTCSSSKTPLEKMGVVGLSPGAGEIVLGSEHRVKIIKKEETYILEAKNFGIS